GVPSPVSREPTPGRSSLAPKPSGALPVAMTFKPRERMRETSSVALAAHCVSAPNYGRWAMAAVEAEPGVAALVAGAAGLAAAFRLGAGASGVANVRTGVYVGIGIG